MSTIRPPLLAGFLDARPGLFEIPIRTIQKPCLFCGQNIFPEFSVDVPARCRTIGASSRRKTINRSSRSTTEVTTCIVAIAYPLTSCHSRSHRRGSLLAGKYTVYGSGTTHVPAVTVRHVDTDRHTSEAS